MNTYQNLEQFFSSPIIILALVILMLWTLFWKGKALWQAARNNDLGWFIVLLVVNTLGILEIVYIVSIAKKNNTFKEKGVS